MYYVWHSPGKEAYLEFNQIENNIRGHFIMNMMSICLTSITLWKKRLSLWARVSKLTFSSNFLELFSYVKWVCTYIYVHICMFFISYIHIFSFKKILALHRNSVKRVRLYIIFLTPQHASVFWGIFVSSPPKPNI